MIASLLFCRNGRNFVQSLVRIGHPNELCLPAVNTAAQCPTAAPVGAVIHKASPIFSLFFLLWVGNFRDIAYFRTLFAAAEVPAKTNRQPDVGNRHHENAKLCKMFEYCMLQKGKSNFYIHKNTRHH